MVSSELLDAGSLPAADRSMGRPEPHQDGPVRRRQRRQKDTLAVGDVDDVDSREVVPADRRDGRGWRCGGRGWWWRCGGCGWWRWCGGCGWWRWCGGRGWRCGSHGWWCGRCGGWWCGRWSWPVVGQSWPVVRWLWVVVVVRRWAPEAQAAVAWLRRPPARRPRARPPLPSARETGEPRLRCPAPGAGPGDGAGTAVGAAGADLSSPFSALPHAAAPSTEMISTATPRTVTAGAAPRG